jgi:hypothetical protein
VLREVQWDSFPDNWPNLKITHVKDCRFHAVYFLASFHDPAAVFRQLSVVYALAGEAASKRLTVIVPWYPTGG